MGTGAKTPGRLKAGGQEEGAAAAARGAAAKPEATVDIGALLRNKRSGLLGTSGGFGSLGGSRPAPVAGGAHVPLAASFGNVVTAENPIYSPDDSLARAASKLQNLKAPQAPQPRPPSRAAQAQAAIAAAAAPPAGAASQPDASPEPAPERCESPQLIPAFPAAAAGEQQAPAPDGEGSHKGLSGEDSGELAALSALQKRRKSLGPATAAKQRYGEWFDGSDKDLEHTLQEYNREAPAPSPRMTRAQRRKSLAVDQSLALEPGLARSLLDRSLAAGEEEEEGAAGHGQAQQQAQPPQAAAAGQAQQQKRGAAGRRKSVAATQQVQVALPAERPAQHAHHASIADEVAALNAEMCAALSGLVGEDSPEKGHRGDQRPLREMLLESWDGKTYYERLMAMQEAEQEERQARKQQAAGGAKPQQRGAAAHASKPAARTPGGKAAAANRAPTAAAAHPTAQPAAAAAQAAPAGHSDAARPTPSPLQVALASSSAVAAAKAALMTPNSQRRKLNELTESLQLLKVSTRQSRAAAAIQAAHQQRSGTPAPDSAAPAAAPAAASRVVGSRSVSPEPPAPAASNRASTEPPVAAPKTAGKRGGRRANSPPTEASAALAPAAAATTLPQAPAVPAGQGSGSHAELAVVQERLEAALAENASLAQQLQQAQEELAAERAARAAEQQELEQLRANRKDDAPALKAAEQRAKQLARELQEAQAAAAAHAKGAAELEARWAEAEKALGAVLKAANGGLKAVAAGKEEAKSLGEALRSCTGAGENAAPAPAASSGRSRQSAGRQWR